MDTTLILVLTSIAIVFLIFILLFIFRERAEVKVEEDVLVMHYPLSTKRYSLEQELENWEVQQAQYIRLGIIYSVVMLMKNGKRIIVNSRLNQENFERLYKHLSSRFKHRRIGN